MRPESRGKRFALLVAQFYPEIAARLEDGARRALQACGASESDILRFEVPGCFELPLAARNAIAADPGLDAVVALGAVIRGETAHFDLIAHECARGLMDVQLSTGVPVGFGVLTTESMEQANARAERDGRDKGFEAAMAAAQMVATYGGACGKRSC